MPETTFPAVDALLRGSFHVAPERITPRARLQDLGLDSLALMEFVFAVEDRFSLRIPDDRLDPRQAGLTLADLCRALDELIGTRPAAAA